MRLTASAILTGCEIEGAAEANLFIETTKCEVTGLWSYNSGGYDLATPDYDNGVPYAIGILLGSFGVKAGSSRIQGLIERFPFGAVKVAHTQGGSDLDLTVNAVSGLYYSLAATDASEAYDRFSFRCSYRPNTGSTASVAATKASGLVTNRFNILGPVGPTAAAPYDPSYPSVRVAMSAEDPSYVQAAFLGVGPPIFLTTNGATIPYVGGGACVIWDGPASSTITLPDLRLIPNGLLQMLRNRTPTSVDVQTYSGTGVPTQKIETISTVTLNGGHFWALIADNSNAAAPKWWWVMKSRKDMKTSKILLLALTPALLVLRKRRAKKAASVA